MPKLGSISSIAEDLIYSCSSSVKRKIISVLDLNESFSLRTREEAGVLTSRHNSKLGGRKNSFCERH